MFMNKKDTVKRFGLVVRGLGSMLEVVGSILSSVVKQKK
jgi:hypothetical protein